MARIFLAERLTRRVLDRFSDRIAAAAACTAIDAPESAAAAAALRDGRWRPGTVPLFDRASGRAKDWIRDFVFAQPFSGPRALLHRGLLACSLEGRLRAMALGLGLYDHCVSTLDGPVTEIRLDLVADDPYLRDGFRHRRWLTAPPQTIRAARPGGAPPFKRHARELMAAQLWLRALPRRRGRSRRPRVPDGHGKTALLVAIARRSIQQLEPALLELRSRGWHVVVVHYGRELPADVHAALSPMDEIVVPFDEVSAGWRRPRRERRKWVLSGAVMRDSPLSARWLRVAVSASWATDVVQIARHRRMLETWRPDAVFGYGADVPNLALQVAAAELSIPTIYVPHGFEVRTRSFYSFLATATLLYGPACAEINAIGPHGQPFGGLVPTGHPPYDALASEFERSGGQATQLPGLAPPPSRPYLVLALAGWGFDLICHLHQQRFLKMLAEALPDDAYLVCKLHPSFEERRFCQSILEAWLPADAFRVVGESEFTTRELLAGCHVAVSNERSMVLTDAIVMGRPGIAIRHPESPLGSGDRNHPGKDFSENCWVVESSGELRAALTALTRDEAARAGLLTNRQRYLERFVLGDGRAAQRIADLVEHLAAGRDAGSFSAGQEW